MLSRSPSGFAKARFAVGISAVVAVATVAWLVAWALLPLMLGWSPIAMSSGSMGPTIDAGDVVVAEPHDGIPLGPGTVVVYDHPSGSGLITHRIVAMSPSGDYVTRGDANGRIDSTPVPADSIDAVGRILVPFVGRPYVWAADRRWPELIAATLALAAALWASRWGLLARFDPWTAPAAAHLALASGGTVATGRPSRPWTAAMVGAAAVMLASVMTGAGSEAAFADATVGDGSSLLADDLAPPTGLTATGGTSITLDWTATSDTYASGHRVFRSTTPLGPYTQVAEVTPRTTATYVDSPAPGTYYYVVGAFYLGWDSPPSNEASATVAAAEDYDAVPAGADNCPATFNIDQFDTDGDGIGDACDPSPTFVTTGSFADSGQSLGLLASYDIAVGDLDGDGDLDLAFANNNDPNTVWLNDGSGTLTDSGQLLDPDRSEGIVMGDLDGDGDLDIAYANNNDANTVWFNDGSGTFTDTGQLLDPNRTEGMALGDFDGDGDLDIVYANDADGNTVYENDGTGTFTDTGQTLSSARSANVAVGDLDGDGDLDIAYANDNDANTVWFNDGTGTFTDSGQLLDKKASLSVALADFDGDGDLDIVYGNNNKDSSVYVNDGTGTFTDSGQQLGKLATMDVAVGDVDGDGDLDVAFAIDGAPNTVWFNDGTGTFTDSGQALGSGNTQGIALGNLDGDGDLDLVYADDGAANTVWFNG